MPCRPSSRPPLRRPRASRSAALTAALALGLAAPVALAAPALAHDRLVSSSPADGDVVGTAPDTVDLRMSETPLALGTQVEVTGPGGLVSSGEPRIVDSTVSQSLGAERPAGTYEVQWRVTSSDGHPVSGSFTFEATGALAESTATEPAADSPAAEAPAESPAETPADEPVSADPAAGLGGSGTGVLVGVLAAVVVVLAGVGAVLRTRRGRR
ncbi:copper resistance CopC family protein [Kineococcus sp. SYSU DK004]|uniref:copper resistance CopC family protein n=1 Tax=Kineococcus sp. SYSU DK004 TaxID=3383125 RepID=UPI003D7D1504